MHKFTPANFRRNQSCVRLVQSHQNGLQGQNVQDSLITSGKHLKMIVIHVIGNDQIVKVRLYNTVNL